MANKPKGHALPTDKHVGSRVRFRREMLNMSQSVLGKMAGITFQQVQKYEKGINRISASRLQQFAEALQVDVGYFFEGASGKKANPAGPKHELNDSKALMEAFSRIKRKIDRKKVLNFARSLAAPI